MNAHYRRILTYFSVFLVIALHIIIFLLLLIATLFDDESTLSTPQGSLPELQQPAQEPAPVILREEAAQQAPVKPIEPVPSQRKHHVPEDTIVTSTTITVPEPVQTQAPITPSPRAYRTKQTWYKKVDSTKIDNHTTQNTQEQTPAQNFAQNLSNNFKNYLQQQQPVRKSGNFAQDFAEQFNMEMYQGKLFNALVTAARTYTRTYKHDGPTINTKVCALLEIDPDGKMVNISLDKSSGNDSIDAAIRGLCKAARFPRRPKSLGQDTFVQRVNFIIKTPPGSGQVHFTASYV